MLSIKNRFFGKNSLSYVYRNGLTLRSNYFSVKYATNKRRTNFRLAVVVSKKITKSAPKRNRIRRRIYEVVRLNSDQYLTNQDIIITVFDDKLADMPHDDLVLLISQQLEQVKAHS